MLSRKISLILGLPLCMVFFATVQANEVSSLRGVNKLDAPSDKVELKRWKGDRKPIERDYVQQPPLIPHSVEGYRINLKFNKCLTCHSWANYKQNNATKISQTHFEDREGSVLANVSARRYFCSQCHVPQVEARPLVENTFKPLRSIRHR